MPNNTTRVIKLKPKLVAAFQTIFERFSSHPFQKPVLGLTALHGFLVGEWLEVEGEDGGLAAVYGAQLSTGSGWNSAILFAAEEEEEEEEERGREVNLQMSGLPSSVLFTSYTLEDRGSSFALWQAMGKPLKPTRLQAEALVDSAALRHSPVQHLSERQGIGNLTLRVPGRGVLMLRLCSNSTSSPPQPYWLTALPGWKGSLFLSWRLPESTSCVASFQLEFSPSHSVDQFAPLSTGLLTLRTATLFR